MTGPCECDAPGHIRSAIYQLPLCDACFDKRRAMGMEPEPDEPFVAPKIEPGALSWDYLGVPQSVGVVGRDREIVINGVIMYQQEQPVHVRGSGYRSAVVKTVRREISEAEAARRLAAQAAHALEALTDKQAAAITSKVAGRRHADAARAEGVSPAAVRMRAYRGRRAAKGK